MTPDRCPRRTAAARAELAGTLTDGHDDRSLHAAATRSIHHYVRTDRHEIVLGIDLGTSYTSAGALVDGRVELVVDQGDTVIPSVVYLPSRGPPVVGREAASRAAAEPTATISSVKRFLGLPADGDVVRRLSAGVPYRLRAVAGHLVVSARGGDYACEQLAAAILSRVRDLAEQRFGGVVRRVVMTVAATATPGYVEALRRAARIAHLEIVQVVSEPIAGALALGLHAESTRRKLVVCDFGGGTFDVTAVVQDGRRFAPVATCGEEYLGGDDLDLAMANAIAGVIYQRSRFDVMHDRVRSAQLVQRCESVKRTLSTQLEAPLAMREAYVERGEHRTLNVVIERKWIEPVWQPIIDRAVCCVSDAMARARWTAADVDQVVLIGGSSTVPLFRESLGRIVAPERISTTPLASVAVAMGATLVTGMFVAAIGGVPVPDPTTAAILAGTSATDELDGIPIDWAR